MNLRYLVLCVLLFVKITSAQNADHAQYIGIEHGLSNNAVTSIYQDHNGFMWFGTYDGLNRYDGYTFRVFRNEFNDTNSVANNRIACITEDRHNRLWIGTRGGVSIYSDATGRF